MLLLPYRDKSVARSLPVVTIVIALACTLVYFFFQGKDAARDEAAYAYYLESGLDQIEVPRYQAFLAGRDDAGSAERLHLLQSVPAHSGPAAQLLQSDAHFQQSLHSGQVVHEQEPDFAAWNQKRSRFDQLLGASLHARYALARPQYDEVWRYFTYAFLHGGLAHLVGNLLVLVLVGPFVEAALGRARFALGYLLGGAAAGALHVLLSDAPVIGASGAIAATVGMLAILYGTRKVPVFYWFFFMFFGTAQIPALALLPVWLINEAYQWSQQARGLIGSSVAYAAHIGGLCAGAALALALQPRKPLPAADKRGASGASRGTEAGSTLAAQAQDAASRLDIRRATRLYRELVDLEPKRTDYMIAYLNVAVLGADEEAVQDAALRLLWAKSPAATDDLRKTFLQLTQPKVLKALPIDEHLRLSRRLVRFREDAAALRVIDALLRDDHMRALYGRQLADSLLGIFTAYTRNGLHKQAEQINSRLATYFPAGDKIGGMAPSHQPPSTLLSSVRTGSRQGLGSPGMSPRRSPPPQRGDRLPD